MSHFLRDGEIYTIMTELAALQRTAEKNGWNNLAERISIARAESARIGASHGLRDMSGLPFKEPSISMSVYSPRSSDS